MNLVVRSLLMMSLLLTLANCSNDGSKPFTNEYDDQSAADQFVNNFDLQCDGPCLEGVGGLLTTSETIKHGYFVTTTSYSVGFCSQTLIGPDLVLTNRHCLSDKVNQYKGRSCGEMTAVFPAQNGKPAQRVKCASIVDMSEDLEADKDGKIEKNGADWAILRLAQTVNRKYFKVNTNGVPHDSKIVAHPVIYEKGWDDRVKHGRIRKAECTSKMNHSSSAFYISPQSLLVTSDCNINFPSGSSG